MVDTEIPQAILAEKITELKNLLTQHDIKFDMWGMNATKTIGQLALEILTGDCELTVEEGKLIRKVQVVSVDVSYVDKDGMLFLLFEDRQVFKDGTVRRRAYFGLREKMKKNENKLAAAQRALKEELKIITNTDMLEGDFESAIEQPPSYPGLESKYAIFPFSYTMPEEYYKPEGYIDEQDDKTTFFVWIEPPQKNQSLS